MQEACRNARAQLPPTIPSSAAMFAAAIRQQPPEAPAVAIAEVRGAKRSRTWAGLLAERVRADRGQRTNAERRRAQADVERFAATATQVSTIGARAAAFHHLERWGRAEGVDIWQMSWADVERYLHSPTRTDPAKAFAARSRFHNLQFLATHWGFPVAMGVALLQPTRWRARFW